MVWVVVMLALLIPLIAVVLDSQLGRAIAGRFEQRSVGREEGQLGSRVTALEAEVDRMNKELERTREENEFVRKLLEKPESGALPPGDAN
jgi:hypothetical protein